jgi:ABC-type multidrug transport system fused ATPase/permease subunit
MSGIKVALEKIKGSPFYTFSELPLNFIEKHKIYKYVFIFICFVMAAVTIVYPFAILGRVINSGYFNFGVKYIFAFIFTWLAVLAACWLCFHLWLKRRKESEEFASSEFVALPFFAKLIRTFGEWLGILYAVIGLVGGLFSLIFLGKYSGRTLSAILFGVKPGAGFKDVGDGALGLATGSVMDVISGGISGIKSLVINGAVILGPLAGLLIIFISRFIAERLWVLAAIANNTKKS